MNGENPDSGVDVGSKEDQWYAAEDNLGFKCLGASGGYALLGPFSGSGTTGIVLANLLSQFGGVYFKYQPGIMYAGTWRTPARPFTFGDGAILVMPHKMDSVRYTSECIGTPIFGLGDDIDIAYYILYRFTDGSTIGHRVGAEDFDFSGGDRFSRIGYYSDNGVASSIGDETVVSFDCTNRLVYTPTNPAYWQTLNQAPGFQSSGFQVSGRTVSEVNMGFQYSTRSSTLKVSTYIETFTTSDWSVIGGYFVNLSL